MARIVKGEEFYKDIMKSIANNERESKVRQITENEGKNIVHGSNIKAYHNDFTKPFCTELQKRKEDIREKILTYSTDDAGNIDCFIKAYGEYVKYNCDDQSFYI